MRETKDSEVEWIGEVPQNWKQSKVKYLMSLTNGRAYKQQELLAKGTYRVLRVGNFNTNDKWYYSDLELPEKQYCEKGDLLYLWATTFGPAFWNEEKVIYHYHIWKVDRFRNYLQRYAFYALDANAEWQRMQSHGSTMVHVTKEGVENTMFPVPALPEQRRIVAFLDERCAAIDADIAKRREVIEKLGEYKRSFIARAVTKGLDSDAEMKDSGIKWTTTIPSNWQTAKLKTLFEVTKRIAGVDGLTVLSITQDGIKPKDFSTGKGQFAETYSHYQLVRRGDFAMNHMDLLTGWVDISSYDGVTSPDYRVFVTRDTTVSNPKYFLYLFQMCYLNRIFFGSANGVADKGRMRLQTNAFNNFVVPLPPLEEQKRIAAYLDERCVEVDEAILRQEQLIAKLEEYRKSLIYHAVTGKIDCREEANAR